LLRIWFVLHQNSEMLKLFEDAREFEALQLEAYLRFAVSAFNQARLDAVMPDEVVAMMFRSEG
jgi:hypothetical protein